METTAYVLGMLTITLVAMISVIVVGIVKIIKLQKHVKEINLNYYRDMDHIHRRIEDTNSEVWRQFERAGKDVTMVEQTLMNQINLNRQEMDRGFIMINEALSHEIEHGKRYTDSRIDKLIDTYFAMAKVNEKKEILKG